MNSDDSDGSDGEFLPAYRNLFERIKMQNSDDVLFKSTPGKPMSKAKQQSTFISKKSSTGQHDNSRNSLTNHDTPLSFLEFLEYSKSPGLKASKLVFNSRSTNSFCDPPTILGTSQQMQRNFQNDKESPLMPLQPSSISSLIDIEICNSTKNNKHCDDVDLDRQRMQIKVEVLPQSEPVSKCDRPNSPESDDDFLPKYRNFFERMKHSSDDALFKCSLNRPVPKSKQQSTFIEEKSPFPVRDEIDSKGNSEITIMASDFLNHSNTVEIQTQSLVQNYEESPVISLQPNTGEIQTQSLVQNYEESPVISLQPNTVEIQTQSLVQNYEEPPMISVQPSSLLSFATKEMCDSGQITEVGDMSNTSFDHQETHIQLNDPSFIEVKSMSERSNSPDSNDFLPKFKNLYERIKYNSGDTLFKCSLSRPLPKAEQQSIFVEEKIPSTVQDQNNSKGNNETLPSFTAKEANDSEEMNKGSDNIDGLRDHQAAQINVKSLSQSEIVHTDLMSLELKKFAPSFLEIECLFEKMDNLCKPETLIIKDSTNKEERPVVTHGEMSTVVVPNDQSNLMCMVSPKKEKSQAKIKEDQEFEDFPELQLADVERICYKALVLQHTGKIPVDCVDSASLKSHSDCDENPRPKQKSLLPCLCRFYCKTRRKKDQPVPRSPKGPCQIGKGFPGDKRKFKSSPCKCKLINKMCRGNIAASVKPPGICSNNIVGTLLLKDNFKGKKHLPQSKKLNAEESATSYLEEFAAKSKLLAQLEISEKKLKNLMEYKTSMSLVAGVVPRKEDTTPCMIGLPTSGDNLKEEQKENVRSPSSSSLGPLIDLTADSPVSYKALPHCNRSKNIEHIVPKFRISSDSEDEMPLSGRLHRKHRKQKTENSSGGRHGVAMGVCYISSSEDEVNISKRFGEKSEVFSLKMMDSVYISDSDDAEKDCNQDRYSSHVADKCLKQSVRGLGRSTDYSEVLKEYDVKSDTMHNKNLASSLHPLKETRQNTRGPKAAHTFAFDNSLLATSRVNRYPAPLNQNMKKSSIVGSVIFKTQPEHGDPPYIENKGLDNAPKTKLTNIYDEVCFPSKVDFTYKLKATQDGISSSVLSIAGSSKTSSEIKSSPQIKGGVVNNVSESVLDGGSFSLSSGTLECCASSNAKMSHSGIASHNDQQQDYVPEHEHYTNSHVWNEETGGRLSKLELSDISSNSHVASGSKDCAPTPKKVRTFQSFTPTCYRGVQSMALLTYCDAGYADSLKSNNVPKPSENNAPGSSTTHFSLEGETPPSISYADVLSSYTAYDSDNNDNDFIMGSPDRPDVEDSQPSPFVEHTVSEQDSLSVIVEEAFNLQSSTSVPSDMAFPNGRVVHRRIQPERTSVMKTNVNQEDTGLIHPQTIVKNSSLSRQPGNRPKDRPRKTPYLQQPVVGTDCRSKKAKMAVATASAGDFCNESIVGRAVLQGEISAMAAKLKKVSVLAAAKVAASEKRANAAKAAELLALKKAQAADDRLKAERFERVKQAREAKRVADAKKRAEAKEKAEQKKRDAAKSKAASKPQGKSWECPICFEPRSASTQLSATPCGHVFCKLCIVQVARSVGNCPLCNRVFTEDQVTTLFFDMTF